MLMVRSLNVTKRLTFKLNLNVSLNFREMSEVYLFRYLLSGDGDGAKTIKAVEPVFVKGRIGYAVRARGVIETMFICNDADVL